ncbi:hypothetical protein [Kitasatospora sp. HPMI-4]|uniref:hypothetical protein n=1 Tax=Kitasatospora sp. HPMI-4 TaxID=3448443 RepID=UPI003F1D54B2
MRVRDFLARFRPTGTPGAAATGVPADRAAELAAELGPSLNQLTQAQNEAATIRADAADRAEQVRREAAEQAAELIAQARAGAPKVREEAGAAVRRSVEAEVARLLDAAERSAEQVRRRARERMPALVDRIAAEAFRPPEERGRPR